MESKEALRKSAKILRKSLDIKEISAKILRIFSSSEIYKNAKNIALYYPYGSELDLRGIFLEKSKNFYLPKTSEDGKISFHKYVDEVSLEKGFGGILEPKGEKINPEIFDLMILPCLMADRNGFRLGYGKGCYDRFLQENKLTCKKIICLASALLVSELPAESWDVGADLIITENEMIYCS